MTVEAVEEAIRSSRGGLRQAKRARAASAAAAVTAVASTATTGAAGAGTGPSHSVGAPESRGARIRRPRLAWGSDSRGELQQLPGDRQEKGGGEARGATGESQWPTMPREGPSAGSSAGSSVSPVREDHSKGGHRGDSVPMGGGSAGGDSDTSRDMRALLLGDDCIGMLLVAVAVIPTIYI